MIPALSIKPVMAWLIVHGGKNIENRHWTTGYRGRFLVHASKTLSRADYAFAQSLDVELPSFEELPTGAIIGSVYLDRISPPTHVQDPSLQKYFYKWGDPSSKFWWHLTRPCPWTPEPCAGQLGFFFPPIQEMPERLRNF